MYSSIKFSGDKCNVSKYLLCFFQGWKSQETITVWSVRGWFIHSGMEMVCDEKLEICHGNFFLPFRQHLCTYFNCTLSHLWAARCCDRLAVSQLHIFHTSMVHIYVVDQRVALVSRKNYCISSFVVELDKGMPVFHSVWTNSALFALPAAR